MRTVYADSPGAAFALNEDLNQRAAANYLNSVQANRGAQQAAWNAGYTVDAAQRSQADNMLRMIFGLLQNRQAMGENRRVRDEEGRRRAYEFGENLKLANREQDWREKQIPAGTAKLEAQKKEAEDEQNQLADYAQSVADQLNQRAEFDRMVGSETSPGRFMQMVPKQDPGRLLVRLLAGKDLRAEAANRGANTEAMRAITGEASNLPMDFSNVQETPEAFARAAIAAATARRNQYPAAASIKNLDRLVTLDASGRYVPLIRRTGPAGGGTVTATSGGGGGGGTTGTVSAAVPPATQPGTGAQYFRSEAEARAAGMTPGVIFMMFDPASGIYRRARLTS